MPLRTVQQYVESLRDNRTVYFRGQRVPDVTRHPVISVAVEHASIDYRLAEDPASRDLAVVTDVDGVEYSRYYQIPRSADDLLMRSALIEQATAAGGTLVVLIKEIGTDALCALMRVAADLDAKSGSGYAGRVDDFYKYCRSNDLAIAVAQTDVKGDRSLPPSAQQDPDLYVHIVDRRRDGIVVRGAKAHTSVSTNANELIVLPTRARSSARQLGMFVPDPLYVNMAKYHFAHGYHEAVRNVQDIAGGSLVTGPGAEDLAEDETARYYERLYVGRAGVSGLDRLRALALVKDLVASEFATYQEVLAVHAEGSLEAEKLMLFRSYDSTPALGLVRRLAGISH
jgi:aromatic ring hydroxylase